MVKILSAFILITWLSVDLVYPQKRRETYETSLVGDRITPAVSSVMMPRTYTEVLLASSLLTSNSYYDFNRKLNPFDSRYSYSFNTLMITHGISASNRFNIGVDLNYRIGREDADRNSSPLAVFGNSGDGLIEYARALTSIGFRMRYVPFNNNKNFVIQHTYFVPVNTSPGVNFLGDNRHVFNTQLLYNYLIGSKLFLFGQADIFVRFRDDQGSSEIINPLNVFLSYLATKHFFPFAQVGMTNRWTDKFDHLSQSFSYGVGIQYQFTTMFTINAFYNDTFAGKFTSDFKSFNAGIRVVL